jgi:predicted nucleic acid-binding protein
VRPDPSPGATVTVFGARLIRTRAELARQYHPLIAGRRAYISFVTDAELRFGARWAGWGAARIGRMKDQLATADVLWPGPDLIETYVDLRHRCVSIGHGLAQKEHEADRWVAATALWLGVPLVAHDRIFRDVPGLQLLTTLP